MTAVLTAKRALAVCAVVLLAATVALLPLTLLSHLQFDAVVALVIGVPSGVVGLLVARRQPGNPLGWLLLGIALCLILATDGSEYDVLRYRLGYHLPLGVAALAVNQLWGPGLELFGLVVLLFPDGQLSSAWWRAALRAYLGLYVLSLLSLAVATVQAIAHHPIQVDATGGLTATDHPAGWYASVTLLLLIMVLFIVAFIGRQVLSWRRSSGERRQQLKWLASGAVVTVASAGLAATAQPASPATVWQVISGLGWFGFAALPVSIGVAILKYRLYDIDRIISRTLAYALVTGLLIGVYAGLVLLATEVLQLTSSVAVAAATLAAAALFNPVRRRVQRVVDRRFNRARYSADQLVARFSTRLSESVDLESAGAQLTGVMQEALEPAHVSLWISGGAR
ncbi:MAG: hypothetical protein ACLPKI_01070 [Streptosporangiaceae bacterium]